MRLLKYFILGYLMGFILLYPVFLFLYVWNKALIAALVGGGVYSLFVVGFMSRMLKSVSLEINASNKDREKGLSWYYDLIIEQIRDMRFRQYLDVDGLKKFKPVGIYQVLENPIEVRVTPYDINVKCSKMMKRIISDLIEIDEKDL